MTKDMQHIDTSTGKLANLVTPPTERTETTALHLANPQVGEEAHENKSGQRGERRGGEGGKHDNAMGTVRTVQRESHDGLEKGIGFRSGLEISTKLADDQIGGNRKSSDAVDYIRSSDPSSPFHQVTKSTTGLRMRLTMLLAYKAEARDCFVERPHPCLKH